MVKLALTSRAMDIAIQLREEVVKVPEASPAAWGHFTDFIRATAAMVEGAETLIQPTDMQLRFQAAWEACARLWMAENNRILRDCLGQEEFDRVLAHPNARKAFDRILQRVKDQHGELALDMPKVKVEVDDILQELDIVS